MKLISIIQGCAGNNFSFIRGQRVEVSNDLAFDLINAEYAVEVQREKPIAQTPEIIKTVIEPTDIGENEIVKAVVTDSKKRRKK
jgi:Ni,Fe-hydrogenase I small subunit